MNETVHVDFYTVTQSGYYDEEDQHQFCTLAELLAQANSWAATPGSKLKERKTFECAEEHDPHTVYLGGSWHDAKTGDYFLTTWNGTPHDKNGGALSVPEDSSFGEVQPSASKTPKNHIVGYPTYFWVVPSKMVLATVKPEGASALNGHKGLCRFLHGFLHKFSSHVVAPYPDENDDPKEVKIAGYRASKKSQAMAFEPRFETRRARRRGPLERLRKNCPQITKVLFRDKLTVDDVLAKRVSNRFLLMLLGEKPPVLSHRTNFAASMAFKPTPENLEKVISKWTATENESYNVGFQLKAEKSPIWLNKSLANAKPSLDVKRSGGMMSGEHLLSQLVLHRDAILTVLDKVKDAK